MLVLNFGKRFPHALNRIKRCNVLVVGNTGVGKSTLISTLFQTQIKDEITRSISSKPYTKQNSSIAVYDTPGLERDKQQCSKVKHDINQFIKKQNQKEPEEQIHAVWYCLNSQTTRESEIDQQWLISLAQKVPIVFVITRSLGTEKNSLQIFLEKELKFQPNSSITNYVVSVLAQPETTMIGKVESHGLGNLLSTTETFLEGIAKASIQNAVNARARKAFIWCSDGCAKVLTAQMLPISIAKLPVSTFCQTAMIAGIAKTFGYHFDNKFIAKLCTLATGAAGWDSFLEEGLKRLPVDYNNMQTVKDVLAHVATAIDQASGVLPFKDQLVEMLSGFAETNPMSGLPLLTSLTAITTTLSTGILASTFIETMRIYKTAEYEKRPLPDLTTLFAEQWKLTMNFIKRLIEGDWKSNFAGN